MPPNEAPRDLVIRRAAPGDAADFARYLTDPAVFGGLMQLPWPSPAMWLKRLEREDPEASDDRIHLVAVQGGRVVGSAGLTGFERLRRRHAAGLGLSVAAEAQGQGVGTALMHAVLHWADRWAMLLRVELTVFADNTRAIRLYERCGFEREGRMRGYAVRDGAYCDVLFMARLRPGGSAWPAPPPSPEAAR
jgi:putative acetyltransferase